MLRVSSCNLTGWSLGLSYPRLNAPTHLRSGDGHEALPHTSTSTTSTSYLPNLFLSLGPRDIDPPFHPDTA